MQWRKRSAVRWRLGQRLGVGLGLAGLAAGVAVGLSREQIALNPAVPGDFLGRALAVAGDSLLVGAPESFSAVPRDVVELGFHGVRVLMLLAVEPVSEGDHVRVGEHLVEAR